MTAIRVLVADHTWMNSDLLSEALRRKSQFQILTSVAMAPDLVSQALEFQPHVAVLSACGSDGQGFERIRELRRYVPSSRFLVLIDSQNRETVVEAFRSGARGVFCRSNSIDVLCKCIERVSEGHIWASNNDTAFLLEALAEKQTVRMTPNGVALLSAREKQVVRYVATGMSNKDIAEELRLSEHTIKNYLFRIFDKLGVSNRAELIFLTFSSSNVPPDSSATPATLQIPEDERAAFEWSKREAERFTVAQLMLGEMYRDGRGTEKDTASAYFWFLIAELTAQQRAQASRQARIRVGAKLTPVEIAKLERRATDWLGSHDNNHRLTTVCQTEKKAA